MIFLSSISAQNSLSFEYLGGDSLNINLTNDEDVGGFEIEIIGVDIISASGGSAEANGFYIAVAGSTILGFSLDGSTISPSDSLLFTLHFNSDSDTNSACFSDGFDMNNCEICGDSMTCAACADCILSNSKGAVLKSDLILGECVEGCFNESACNYLTNDSCEYSITYYQDADGDGFGNLDITQVSCEPSEGWVTNSDDDNDTCSGGISSIDDSCCVSNTFDDCGVCDGGGPLENFDCDGNCLVGVDCAGDCGGNAEVDECGDCNGNNTAMDACGNCGGDCVTVLTDFVVCSPTICSEEEVDCISNSSNLVLADCLGECGGDTVENECGECNGSDECLSIQDYRPYSVSITSTYPNPFNPSINIEYSVASVGHVSLQIIGLDGKQIETITNSIQTQGRYNVQWAPINVSSGMYLIQLKANNQIQNKKILYLK
tara:strand:- start:335 stop:1630 length:1296 start_codon:yes stop_codon:yes gene_type:complete